MPDANALPGNGLPDGAVPVEEQNQAAISDAVADERKRIKTVASEASHTRTKAMYVGWIVGVVALIVLLVFIIANLTSVEINFLFAKVELPVGIAILIAAIIGALITAALGGARILQLNRVLKKAGKKK